MATNWLQQILGSFAAPNGPAASGNPGRQGQGMPLFSALLSDFMFPEAAGNPAVERTVPEGLANLDLRLLQAGSPENAPGQEPREAALEKGISVLEISLPGDRWQRLSAALENLRVVASDDRTDGAPVDTEAAKILAALLAEVGLQVPGFPGQPGRLRAGARFSRSQGIPQKASGLAHQAGSVIGSLDSLSAQTQPGNPVGSGKTNAAAQFPGIYSGGLEMTTSSGFPPVSAEDHVIVQEGVQKDPYNSVEFNENQSVNLQGISKKFRSFKANYAENGPMGKRAAGLHLSQSEKIFAGLPSSSRMRFFAESSGELTKRLAKGVDSGNVLSNIPEWLPEVAHFEESRMTLLIIGGARSGHAAASGTEARQAVSFLQISGGETAGALWEESAEKAGVSLREFFGGGGDDLRVDLGAKLLAAARGTLKHASVLQAPGVSGGDSASFGPGKANLLVLVDGEGNPVAWETAPGTEATRPVQEATGRGVVQQKTQPENWQRLAGAVRSAAGEVKEAAPGASASAEIFQGAKTAMEEGPEKGGNTESPSAVVRGHRQETSKPGEEKSAREEFPEVHGGRKEGAGNRQSPEKAGSSAVRAAKNAGQPVRQKGPAGMPVFRFSMMEGEQPVRGKQPDAERARPAEMNGAVKLDVRVRTVAQSTNPAGKIDSAQRPGEMQHQVQRPPLQDSGHQLLTEAGGKSMGAPERLEEIHRLGSKGPVVARAQQDHARGRYGVHRSAATAQETGGIQEPVQAKAEVVPPGTPEKPAGEHQLGTVKTGIHAPTGTDAANPHSASVAFHRAGLRMSGAENQPAAMPAGREQVPFTRVAEQIVRSIQLQIAGKTQRMRVQLHPKHLGAVEILVTRSKDKTHATLYVERPEVRQALESGLSQLHRQMAEQNIPIDRIEVQAFSAELQRQDGGAGEGGLRRGQDPRSAMGHGSSGRGEIREAHVLESVRDFGYNTVEILV